MANFWLPGESDFARALRGWPSSPNVKPPLPVKANYSNPALQQYLDKLLVATPTGFLDLSKGKLYQDQLSASTYDRGYIANNSGAYSRFYFPEAIDPDAGETLAALQQSIFSLAGHPHL